MMNKRVMMLLTFIVLLSISSVSASADLTDGTIAADDSTGIMISDDSALPLSLDDAEIDQDDKDNEDNIKNIYALKEDNTESADSFSQLSDILSDSSIGDTIYLNKDYKYDNDADRQYQGGIEVKSITIDGNGHYIDANGQSRIFFITGNDVVLRNIKFLNGNSMDNGGAIYASCKNINITDCVFENNHANENGGAIYLENGLENSQIGSEFINNSANIAGAIYSNGVYLNNTIQGNFINSTAIRTGGAIYIKGESLNNLFDARFLANQILDLSGGAITLSGNSINNTFKNKFENNSAFYGGAIYFSGQSDFNQFDAEFTNNFAESCGGAIFFYSTTNGNVFNSKFLANVAKTGNGGAVTFKNTSRNCVFNDDFKNNSATYGGAVNYRVSPINITFNADFKNNSATYGGAINFFEDALDITYNGAFLENLAIFGGAMYVEENASIKGTSFIGNIADYGGAVYINGSSILEDLLFESNWASQEGGAAFVGNMTNITDCIFDGNYADTGAALFIRPMPSPLIPNTDDSDDQGLDDPGLDDSGLDDSGLDNPGLDDSGLDDPGMDDGTGEDINIDDLFPDEDEYDILDNDDFDIDEISDLNIFISNSIFKNSEHFSRGAIYSDHDNEISIENCVFENMSSEYAPAIYFLGFGDILINNTCFNNLHANKTAGAIALLDNVYAIMDNCTFTNISSTKNGGAIYYDSNGWGFSSPVYLVALNSRFINCSSDFGGAIVCLGGGLKLMNNDFIDNSAISGGAVYSSSTFEMFIYDSKFLNNKLHYSSDEGLSFGGALYVDIPSTLKVNNSQFINNSNNAIYCYDAPIKINNSYFENNKEYLCTVYTKKLILGENNCTDDVLADLEDDPFFMLIMTGEGLKLELINNTIDVSSIPSRFNADDWGWMSPFKNQGYSGGCWCFSTCAAIEAALLKSTGITFDLSEQSMQKLMTEYSKYGNNHLVEAGLTTVALQYALSWIGVIPDEYDSFDMIGKITVPISTDEVIHVQDAILTYPRNVSDDLNQIKQAILKYGAVTSDFYAVTEEPNFNENTSAFYCNETDGRDATHAIAIVGWDDNYPASNFIVTPPGDGAWIIKNSYGDENYDNGYVYVSYYDTVICTGEGVAYLFENTENYTKNYQTDIGGEVFILNDTADYSYRNSYQSIGDDYISAVGTFFIDADEDYSLEIYVNDVLKSSQNGKSPFRGFHTIKLESQVPVKEGDNFTVVMKTHSVPVLNQSRMHFKANVSFVDDGSGWNDLSLINAAAVLKVYTLDAPREESKPDRLATRIECGDMVTYAVAKEDGRVGEYFVVTLKDGDGNPLVNKEVQIGFNGVVYTAEDNLTTDENGQVRLQINLGYKGDYTFAMCFLGDDEYLASFEVAKITVKVQTPKLTTSNKSYKASAKTKSLTATFKSAHGKPLVGKWILFTVNGKTYKAKTNSKGIATVNVSLNKKGTYSFTVKYAGDSTLAAINKKAKLTLK